MLLSVDWLITDVSRQPIGPIFKVQAVQTESIIVGLLDLCVGRDSSVGIATGYGLDGPGIESRWGRHFPRLSTPVLGPTQPPVQWEPGLSRG